MAAGGGWAGLGQSKRNWECVRSFCPGPEQGVAVLGIRVVAQDRREGGQRR